VLPITCKLFGDRISASTQETSQNPACGKATGEFRVARVGQHHQPENTLALTPVSIYRAIDIISCAIVTHAMLPPSLAAPGYYSGFGPTTEQHLKPGSRLHGRRPRAVSILSSCNHLNIILIYIKLI
jgi:hypothetical protein